MHQNHQNTPKHLPVLAEEVINCLQPQADELYLDLTAGYGGHASQVVAAIGSDKLATLVDRDEQAIATLQEKFPKARIIHQDFHSALQELAEQGKESDMILADLGVSSVHLDTVSRGFSFSGNGPLDMRMDQRQSYDADQIINSSSEEELAQIISNYGQEPKARTVARRIVQARPIKDTEQLAKIISSAYGGWARRSRVNPATRTFQAIRIAVNDELHQLEQSLPLMESLLAPGGRLAIISFHSLEDRITKQFLADRSGDRYDAELRLLTKKPITASKQELAINPRARSAKLRAAVKLKQK